MAAALTPRQTRMVLFSVMLGLFLGAMEATVVATALPTIVSKFSGLSLYSWPMAIYILTAAVTSPLFGKLSDLHGRKPLYLLSLTLFLLGSLLSGLSHSMMQLIVFRGLQGMGAGGVLPLSITIAGDIFPLEKRAKVQPAFSAMWGVASLIGPPLGIWLTSYSWRFIFFVNVPFGILSGILLSVYLREAPSRREKIPVDYPGGILLTLGLLGFELGLPQEGTPAFPLWRMILLLGSLVIFSLFFSHEKKAEEPILPLSLMKYRIFSSASLCQFFAGISMFGALSFLPLYVETVAGGGIHGTGLTLSYFLISWVLFSFLSSRLMLKWGYRILVTGGAFLVSIGFFMLFQETSKMASNIAFAVTVLGAGMGWIMAPLIVAVQSGVPRKHLGIATSSQVLFRTAGASLGVSAMGAIMASKIQSSLAQVLSGISNPGLQKRLLAVFHNPEQMISPILRAQIPQEALQKAKTSMGISLQAVFLFAFVAALFTLMAAFLIPPGKAREHLIKEETFLGS